MGNMKAKRSRRNRRNGVSSVVIAALILCVLIVALLLPRLGSHQPTEPTDGTEYTEATEPTQPTAPTVPTEPPAPLDYFEVKKPSYTPRREYGQLSGERIEGGVMIAHILYPSGILPSMEQEIRQWIVEVVNACEAIVCRNEDPLSPAVLYITYESLLTEQRYAAIGMQAFLEHDSLKHPVQSCKTFNADSNTEELLTLDSYLELDEEAEEALCVGVAGMAEIPDAYAGSNVLENWLICPGSLELILVPGVHISAENEIRTLVLSLEEARELSQPVPAIDPNKPMLALTFDDGPSKHTERLLDYFAQYGGNGTFFVVGNVAWGKPETLQRIISEGHELGGHSWDHTQLTSLDRKGIRSQLTKTQNLIYEHTGFKSCIMRPPYGSVNATVKEVAKGEGISLINWSVDTLDWEYRNADKVFDSVMSQAKDGAIILLHDLHATTVDAMERVIPALIAEGYQLVTVTELLTCNGGELEPGVVYRSGKAS